MISERVLHDNQNPVPGVCQIAQAHPGGGGNARPLSCLSAKVGGLPHTSEDIALWILPATAPVQPLELSDHEPAENEWVWIVGQEQGKKLNYYLAKVVKAGGGSFALQQQRPFDTNGFSGGPILTTTGKVIGTTLGATDQGRVIGTTVTSLRNRIAGY